MNTNKQFLLGACLFGSLLGNASAASLNETCQSIHAPTGAVDTDASTTAKYAVSHNGVSLTSAGNLTVRYPLTSLKQRDDYFDVWVGYRDSYADALVKVELVEQRFAPVSGGPFNLDKVAETRKITVFDSDDWNDAVGYRRQSTSESLYQLGYFIDLDKFVYSLEVTLQKKVPFERIESAGSGVAINNIRICSGNDYQNAGG